MKSQRESSRLSRVEKQLKLFYKAAGVKAVAHGVMDLQGQGHQQAPLHRTVAAQGKNGEQVFPAPRKEIPRRKAFFRLTKPPAGGYHIQYSAAKSRSTAISRTSVRTFQIE